jgi:hypothetical protein
MVSRRALTSARGLHFALPPDQVPFKYRATRHHPMTNKNSRRLRFSALRGIAALAGAVQLGAAAPAGATPGALPPRTVRIGQGGTDGFVATGADGTIHVVYGGKYRTGPAADRLGPEETMSDLTPVDGVRIAVDRAGTPHVVFTTGSTDQAKRSYYTAREGGRWRPAEKFADADELRDRTRAYVADVAVDDRGHALVSCWVSRPTEQRNALEDWCFYYRWRTPGGAWSELRSLPAHWSSAPKVEYGRDGYYLLWQHRATDWRIAGPVPAGGTFAVEGSRPSGSAALGQEVQNEGADFSLHPSGALIVAGNRREKFEGPVGVWATAGTPAALPPPVYLGSFPGTKRGNESGVHPVTAFDVATGHAFVAVLDAGTKRALFSVHRPGLGWARNYTPILPDFPGPQGTLRQGPSLADVPGPGILALVRDGGTGGSNWYLRTLLPGEAEQSP